jgi:hypothetical protein
MAKTKVVVEGLKRTRRSLQKLGEKAEVKVHAITGDNATTIAINASLQASITSFDLGDLAAGIQAEEVAKKKFKIVVKEKYAPYVEFGTGTMVSVPPELKKIAEQFRGKGIRKVNLPARPFLYPAFVEGRLKYLKDLKNLLKELTK